MYQQVDRTTGLDPREYQRKQALAHIRDVPDMYVGSMVPDMRNEWLLNYNTGIMFGHEFIICGPIERLFIEILINAADNADRSWRKGVDPGAIIVMANYDTIIIRNNGIPIPVAMHPEEKIWVPELIFGSLHTSSNYDP